MNPNQNSRLQPLCRLVTSGLLLWGGAAAAGPGLQTGFEAPDYDGSSDGVPVAGQNGWYVPNVAGSVDQFIFTYDSNALGVPADPFGDDQFLGGQTPDIGMFPRAQLGFDWSQASAWTVSYDITNAFNGELPANDNISSFSLQDSTVARYFIAVNTWSNPDTADHWDANYIAFDSTGVPADPPGLSPGAAWRNLAVGHWYNQSTTFDFDSNTITFVTITDLETFETTGFAPTGWYLAGGATFRPPLPTALRFFVGGGNDMVGPPGNVGAFDNLTIVPASGAGASAPSESDQQGVQRARGKAGATTN
jgi:hypothetical protein